MHLTCAMHTKKAGFVHAYCNFADMVIRSSINYIAIRKVDAKAVAEGRNWMHGNITARQGRADYNCHRS